MASRGTTVPVVRCQTLFGIDHAKTAPSRIAVLHAPASVAGLVAYTNFQYFLIGPGGMKCAGEVGIDGHGTITVWPPGHSATLPHSRYAGVTLFVDPVSAPLIGLNGCPFFAKFAASIGSPCWTTSLPPGEKEYVIDSNAISFEDPPAVAGDGWPSGGPDPAHGTVGINAQQNLVYQSTCTLPNSQRWICRVSLNDVLSRYG